MRRPATAAKVQEHVAPVFSALGDATRLALLAQLSDGGEHSIHSLTQTIRSGTSSSRLTRQAVTKHLHVLQRAGLVRCSEHGRERHFDLEQQGFDAARDYLETIAQHWDDALLRLKAHVETS